MNTVEFLAFLRNRDIQIELEGDRLRINAPKDALTPEIREQLTARKAEIIAFLREVALGRETTDLSPIEKIPRGGATPLSFAQQRLWFMDQLAPGSAAYIIPLSLRWRGRVNLDVVEKSLTEIVRRHEVLRTVFNSIDGVPTQVILPADRLTIDVTDLTHLPLAESEKEARRMAAKNAQESFDLAKGPLLRVRLVRLAPEDQVLLVAIHHIVFDGWSIGVLTGELTALYPVFLQGKPSPLSELSVQYADFAQWQRQHVDGLVRETQLTYWKNELGGHLTALDLPTDRPRSTLRTIAGSKCSRHLGTGLTEALKSLGQKQGASLFMVLLATFDILLHRQSGQDDIFVGTPVAGRNRGETESMIGFFVNTLVIRADFSKPLSFQELLNQVSRTTLNAYAHQDMPFEELVSILEPRRDLNRMPLFQVFFNHLNLDAPKLEIEGLVMEPFGDYALESKFDLTIYVTEAAGAVELLLVYKKELFDEARMERMLDQYESLLKSVCLDPTENVDRHSLLTPINLDRWPDPTLSLETDSNDCVHERFIERAGEFPDQMAVQDVDGGWTYAELEQLSAGLAGWLRSRAIGPSDVVVIIGHRGSSLVLAILGVLRAEAAFCIVDPNYPGPRIEEYLRAAKPKALIWAGNAAVLPPSLRDLCQEIVGDRQLQLPQTSSVAKMIELQAAYRSSNKIDPDSLAYVTFTSGTTGNPKCIKGTHRPLSHFMEWQSVKFGLTKGETFSMLSGLAHDPLLRDIFAPLWVGATLCIPDPAEMLVPGYLANWMHRHEIAVAHLTPAMGAIIFDGDIIQFPSLRFLFFGGDVFPPSLAGRINRVAPGAEIVNFYGTTETPQAMAWHKIDPAPSERPDQNSPGTLAPVPIGRPISGVQILILNRSGRLAGMGELGEIFIRTPYLSLGYANDAELTRTRFITNPFTNRSGDRMYRTGDLGRYRPDGVVEFAGRFDQQIKIRGYRVELGEVEAALATCPHVSQCAVVAQREPSDAHRLVAYVVPVAGHQPTILDLKTHLRTTLPDYMMPAVFTFLGAIPITPNGKVDLKALPVPSQDLSDRPGGTFQAPRNKIERVMGGIWSDVLGIKQVGIYDHFFELGGHSLSATKLISRLNAAFGIQIPLKNLFTDPTISALSALIRHDEVDDVYYYIGEPSRWKLLVPAQPKGSKDPFFFVGGYMDPSDTLRILSHLIPHLGLDQPVYGLQPRWLDGRSPRYSSVGEVVGEFVAELQAFRPHGPYLLGGDCVGGIIALEMARALMNQGEEVSLLVMFDTERPTFVRDLAADVRIAYRRGKRIFQKLGQILSWHNPTKKQLIQDIVRRKSITINSEKNVETFDERTYRLRVDYRRMIYCYRVKKYPGKITMIVNQAQYRMDKTMGWAGIADGFEAHVTPGDHWTRYVQYGAQITAVLIKCFERARENSGMR